MISESVVPSSGKRWGKMLARHVLEMHGLGKGKIAPKKLTGETSKPIDGSYAVIQPCLGIMNIKEQ